MKKCKSMLGIDNKRSWNHQKPFCLINNKANLYRLSLNNFIYLTDEALLQILDTHPMIQSIDISGRHSLTSECFQTKIEMPGTGFFTRSKLYLGLTNRPDLKRIKAQELMIEEININRSLVNNQWIEMNNVSHYLKHLEITDSVVLKRISIHLTSLEDLILKNNSGLSELIISEQSNKQLKRLDLSGCNTLKNTWSKEIWGKFLLNLSSLKKVIFPNSKCLNIRKSFPLRRNQKELLETINSHSNISPNVSTTLKLVLIGDSCSGKTALVHRYTEGSFQPSGITSGVKFATKQITLGKTIYKLSILDTVGAESFRTIIRSYYRDTDCFIFTVDVNSSLELDVDQWCDEIRVYCNEAPIILVGTRIDEDSKYRKIGFEQLISIAEQIGAVTCLECSAKTGEGVEDVFMTAAELSLGLGYDSCKNVMIDNAVQQMLKEKVSNTQETNTNKKQIIEAKNYVPSSNHEKISTSINLNNDPTGIIKAEKVEFYNSVHNDNLAKTKQGLQKSLNNEKLAIAEEKSNQKNRLHESKKLSIPQDNFANALADFFKSHKKSIFTICRKTDCELSIQFNLLVNASLKSKISNSLANLIESLQLQLTELNLIQDKHYYISLESEEKILTITTEDIHVLNNIGAILKKTGLAYWDKQQLAANSVFFKPTSQQVISNDSKINHEGENQIDCRMQ